MGLRNKFFKKGNQTSRGRKWAPRRRPMASIPRKMTDIRQANNRIVAFNNKLLQFEHNYLVMINSNAVNSNFSISVCPNQFLKTGLTNVEIALLTNYTNIYCQELKLIVVDLFQTQTQPGMIADSSCTYGNSHSYGCIYGTTALANQLPGVSLTPLQISQNYQSDKTSQANSSTGRYKVASYNTAENNNFNFGPALHSSMVVDNAKNQVFQVVFHLWQNVNVKVSDDKPVPFAMVKFKSSWRVSGYLDGKTQQNLIASEPNLEQDFQNQLQLKQLQQQTIKIQQQQQQQQQQTLLQDDLSTYQPAGYTPQQLAMMASKLNFNQKCYDKLVDTYGNKMQQAIVASYRHACKGMILIPQ